MKAVLKFIKKEPILILAVILAVISCFFVPPSKEYISYINFKTLTSIFSLMIIIKGLSKINTFRIIATKILPYTKSSRGLITVLVFIPTILALFITNDVAVLTFVPFALIVLNMCDMSHLALKTVVLISIGCNLGGLISPMGNSQNLYLFSYYDLPSTFLIQNAYACFIVGVVILFVCCMLTKKQPVVTFDAKKREVKKFRLGVYLALLVLAISAVVLRIKNYYIITFAIVAVTMLFMDRSLYKNINYSILFTFTAFFIFSGNVKNIESIAVLLSKIINGNEFFLLIGLTQFISNTPAVIIISQFSSNILPVVLGANIGKNGTILASLTGVVVMRLYTSFDDRPLRFLGVFTLYGLIFLALMTGVGFLNILLMT
ncbi:MAG: SLC13 family permease [Clostridia bacterium]|nr:SLC13 family permease [Clostridia bacterium]